MATYRGFEREFALLANKHHPPQAPKSEGTYSSRELYDMGATPIGRPLGIVKMGRKEINEVENSDLFLV